MMVEPIIQELLEAGVHFGHQTKRWNPKMKRFIFGEKNGIYLLDLEKTALALKEAQEFLAKAASEGGPILFVGTKRQAQPIVQEQAYRCGQHFVTLRWLGGLLTNFATIRKSVERLKTIREWALDGTLSRLPKKEAAHKGKELARLEKVLQGVIEMERLPKALVVVDVKREETAIKEALRLSIPVVALVDTNCDPDPITYCIPGNDDAIRSIRLILTRLADAILEGHHIYMTGKAQEEKEAAPEAHAAPTQEGAVNLEATPAASTPLGPEAPKAAPLEESSVGVPLGAPPAIPDVDEVERIVAPTILKVEEKAVPKKKRVLKSKSSAKVKAKGGGPEGG